MPNPAEVAGLVVRGQSFEDWESVWVQHRWKEGWPLFRFTAAERAPLPTSWKDAQYKPGDPCTIVLGGELAITGFITQRQVAYDATNHTVQLSGVGRTWAAFTSSVFDKEANFDNMPVMAIAQKVLAPYGVSALPVGEINSQPFDRMQAQPGELVWDFLDKICRMREIILGSDHLGNALLIGQHTSPVVQELIEGVNILKMQCVIVNEQLTSLLAVDGQKATEDGTPPPQSAQMEATARGTFNAAFKFIRIVTEQPVKEMLELQQRANFQNIQQEGTLITAHATVQGWLRDGEHLWRAGDTVFVYSPMAILNMPLSIESATFTQDSSSGTTTTLELVLPWKLGAKPLLAMGPADLADSIPQPPPPATASSDNPVASQPPPETDTPPIKPGEQSSLIPGPNRKRYGSF